MKKETIERLAIVNLDENSDVIEAVTALESGLYVRAIRIIKTDIIGQTTLKLSRNDSPVEHHVEFTDEYFIDCNTIRSAKVSAPVSCLIEYSGGITT